MSPLRKTTLVIGILLLFLGSATAVLTSWLFGRLDSTATQQAGTTVSAASPTPGATATPTPTPPPGTGFRVSGNKILDPNGQQFIVKGMNHIYGPWLPLDDGGYSAPQLQYAQRDFDMLKTMGVNLLRIWVSPIILDPGNEYMKGQLANIVSLAEQRGFVIEITVSSYSQGTGIDGPNSTGFQRIKNVLQYLASTYKGHPYVWLEPLNEPECAGASGTYCSDWGTWHTEQSQLIQIIRNAGFHQPLVINTPDWSWYMTHIDNPQYALSDGNLIYAAHRYGNDNATFWGPNNTANDAGLPEPQAADQAFANAAANHPIIVDEFGNYNGRGFTNSETWTTQFIDYLADWVINRQGSGAVAFNWFWSDGNSHLGTSIAGYQSNPQLVPWGQYYLNNYLKKVPGSRP